MKKFFLMVTLLTVAFNVFAYDPVVNDGYRWNVLNLKQVGDYEYKMGTWYQKLDGDSIYDGKIYKKLNLLTDYHANIWEFQGLLREEKGKVYAMVDSVEYLMFDHNIQVGDQVELYVSISDMKYKSKPVTMTLEKFGVTATRPDKRITIYVMKNSKGETSNWYEGFGWDSGWLLHPMTELVGGGSDHLLCAYDADELRVLQTYYRLSYSKVGCECEESGSLIIPHETGLDNPLENADEILYCNDYRMLQFSNDGEKVITVYDIQGRQVLNTITTSLSVPFAPDAGIYIVTLATANNKYTNKIVVE